VRRVWKDPNKSIHKRCPFTPTKTVCTRYAKPGVSATSRRVSSLRLRAAFFLCSVDGASFRCFVVDGDHGDAGAGACGSITEPGVIGSVRRECRSLGSRNFSADGRPLVTQINCATKVYCCELVGKFLGFGEWKACNTCDAARGMERQRSVEDVAGCGDGGSTFERQPSQDLLRHCKSTALAGDLQTLSVKWRNLQRIVMTGTDILSQCL
jgi:hypothetical protein